MIYVICLDTRAFEAWRASVDYRPSNRQCVMLRTALGDVTEQMRARSITASDSVVRWGDYDQGAHWHEIEDILAARTLTL